jgi:replicative DNA helicase
VSALHNLDAEQALLGALLFDNTTLGRCGPLTAEHFYDPVHGRMFEAARVMIRAGRVADGVSLKAKFAQDDGLHQIGGAAYLIKVMEAAAPLSVQATSYAELIVDLARKRRIVAIANEAIAKASTDTEADAADIAGELEAALLSASLDGEDRDSFIAKADSTTFAIERAELDEARGLSTGFTSIDEMIGGLRPKLYLLGAASSMGKTTLAAAISRNVAAQGFGVVEFLLEMDEIEDGLRTAAALAFVKDHKVASPHYLTAQRGALTSEQKLMMRNGAQRAGALPILTDYRQGRTLSQIEASARRGLARLRKQGHTPGLVVIDHEGLIAAERGARFTSQLERTNARAEALLALPDRLGAAVLVTGQLTKDGKRADGEERLPNTDDWKYGGALIEAAHAVMLLHRAAYYEERKPAHLRDPDLLRSREAMVIVDKARGGRRGRAMIWMDMPTSAVWEAA